MKLKKKMTDVGPKKNQQHKTGGEEPYFNATIKIHKSSATTDETNSRHSAHSSL